MRWPIPASRVLPVLLVLTTAGRSAMLTESEPNDSPAAANPMAVGDTISGSLADVSDVDVFAFGVTAPTEVDIWVHRTPGAAPGFVPMVELLAPDGQVVLASHQATEQEGLRFGYRLETGGPYYARVLAAPGGWAAPAEYEMDVRALATEEHEPNGSPGTAWPIVPGHLMPQDTIFGGLSSSTDVDYFAFDVAGPRVLSASTYPLPGSIINARVTLFDTDGVTPLSSPDAFGAPTALLAYLPAAGRYYVSVREHQTTGIVNRLYGMGVFTEPTGGGDPVSIFSTGYGIATDIVAGPTGELYVHDQFAGNVKRVRPDGTWTVLAQRAGAAVFAVDGHGDLLVAGIDTLPGIRRLSATGVSRLFVQLERGSLSLATVAPDGHVWFTSCVDDECPALRRYDPVGDLVEEIRLPTTPLRMAFSPAGELYYSDGFAVYRMVGQIPQLVMTHPSLMVDLAFDRDTNLYVARPGSLMIVRLDGSIVEEPFARFGLGGTWAMAFARAADGSMTSRLFVTVVRYDGFRAGGGAVLEVNPAGVRAPGFRNVIALFRTDPVPGTTFMGAEFSHTITVANPEPAMTWTLVDGTLPPGLTLNAATGVLSGVARAPGTYRGKIRIDGGGRYGLLRTDVTVSEPTVLTATAVDALLTGTALPPVIGRYLDLQGNDNGRYDVGDLHAFLRSDGAVPRPPDRP